MIHELEKSVFGSIGPLLDRGMQLPEVVSVVEGNTPAWVFVDAIGEPRTALVWSQGMGGFYLVGDEANAAFLAELDPLMDQVLAPRLRKLGLNCFELSGDGERWDSVIERVFANRKSVISYQCIYTLDLERYRPASRAVEDGYEIRAMDRQLLTDRHLRGSEFVHSKVKHFWGTVEAFGNKGFGYVLVTNNEAASICLSGSVAGSVHAIDVETAQPYRRRGFAEVVARMFIDECAEHHLVPHWECMQDNAPSIALAEKLGYTKTVEYKLFSFPLPEEVAR